MHKSVKMGVAALSLGAAAATIGAGTVSADQACVTECQPIRPGADPYSKVTALLQKFDSSESFKKLDVAFYKLGVVFGEPPDGGNFSKIEF